MMGIQSHFGVAFALSHFGMGMRTEPCKEEIA